MPDPPVRRRDESVPIKPCSTCGRKPAGRVEVGSGANWGWLYCEPCGKRTADGQTFEQAVVQWNSRLA
jgi:transcription elongation factor Elf1